MTSLPEFESRLLALDPQHEDFSCDVDELLESVPEHLREELIPTIFRFFEEHPLDDVGAPGSLIHFVEAYYPRYKNLLLASAAACPSCNAILMINRILNSQLDAAERREYLSALEAILASPDCPERLSSDAGHFIAYQSGRGS